VKPKYLQISKIIDNDILWFIPMSKSKIEKVVYLVRHGESEHNVLPVYQSPEAPLSEKGRQQAKKLQNV
jgi:hypothetical protein